MLKLNIFLVLLLYFCISDGIFERHNRQKRSFFLFPMGGLFKLVIGFAIPVKLGTKQSMAIGLNFQYQYQAAQNHSQLEVYPPIISKSRERRQTSKNDRALVYLGLESLMDKYGMNGKMCLLRSICENALDPLNHEANGLYGQLLYILLTPDYGKLNNSCNVGYEYLEAKQAGNFGVDCSSLYLGCDYRGGLLDFISLINEF